MGNNFASVGPGAEASHSREVNNERSWAGNEDPAIAQTANCYRSGLQWLWYVADMTGYTCDFERYGTCGLEQSVDDNSDWTLKPAATSTATDAPTHDHTFTDTTRLSFLLLLLTYLPYLGPLLRGCPGRPHKGSCPSVCLSVCLPRTSS